MVHSILHKARDGVRLSPSDAVELLRCHHLLDLGAAADEIRNSRTDPAIVTYVVDRNINYTNICGSRCDFCAYYRDRNSPDAYVLDYETLDRKIHETLDRGGTQLLLQGGLHPDLGLDYYEDLLRHIKEHFDIHLHALSPPEIVHIARRSGLTFSETISHLREAGLDTIPGGGAEILADSVRARVSPGKCTSDEWIAVMETAHNLGIRTTATMMFGHGETVEERVEHLTRIRDLQGRTHGFTAFIPWTYQPGNTTLGGVSPGGFEYLRTLAVSRVYLDNFTNLQASWVTQGKAVGTVALKFGANDMGGTMMEENVVAAAGCRNSMDEHEMRRLISEMGYRAVKRNTLYQHLEASEVRQSSRTDRDTGFLY